MGRTRKSSKRVTLVLVGLAAAACSRDPQVKRDVYASREDCLADWARKPEDCSPAMDRPHPRGGYYFYGPAYNVGSGGWWGGSGSAWSSSSSSPHVASHAVGSTSVSRGGFGSTGHSSSG